MKHLLFKTCILFWNIFPWKKTLSIIIGKFPKIKSKLYKDLRYKGNMSIKVDKTVFLIYNPSFTTIENELFWNGLSGWEKISLNIWCEFAKKSNIILDIGANTGIYSLISATVNPQAEIFSFEPVKRTVKLLKKNLDLNPDFNIKLIEKAVSNKNGIATFYDLPTESQYSASLNEKMLLENPNRITYDVETIKLDTFETLSNKKIDLIKLDVEMHEPEALNGMINIIKSYRPIILVEILTDNIANQIEMIFKDLNYIYFNINEVSIPKEVYSLTISDYYNFLMIPIERKNEMYNIDYTL